LATQTVRAVVAAALEEGLVAGPGVVAAVVNVVVVVFAVLRLPEVDGLLLIVVVGKTDEAVLEEDKTVPAIELKLVFMLSRDVRPVDDCDETESEVIFVTTELVFRYALTREVRLVDKCG
jgi:hypothetical protein